MTRIQVFVLLMLSSLFAHGQPGIHWGQSDTSDLKQQAKALWALDEPPETLTQLLADVQITVEDDVVRKRVRDIWYYPNASDVQENATDRIVFNQKTDTLTLHTAASIDRQGVVHLFDPQTLRVTDVQEYSIFTDDRQAVLALPGIGAGSLTLLEYEIVTDRAMVEMDWSERIYPQRWSPVEHFRLSVQGNGGGQDLSWASNSDLVSCQPQPDGVVCEGSDLPAVQQDTGVRWADTLGHIAVGETNDWGQVVERSLAAFSKALVDTRGADRLLQELISSEVDDDNLTLEDKIARVHEFVATDIRYVSMSEHGNTITPHSVASVLTSRYGDCKDKSAVLYHLLQRLGVDAYPVLVATNRNSPEGLQVPAMGYFDHMVVCFDRETGKHCLDATNAYTDWQHTPAWIQGKVALPLRADERPTVIPSNPFRWHLAIDTVIEFTTEGGQRERQHRSYEGEYAGSMREFLAGKSVEGRQQWAVDNYQQQVSNLATPTFRFEGVESLQPEVVIHSQAEYEPLVDTSEDLSYVEEDAWLKGEISSLRLQKRHYDDYFPGLKVTARHEYDVGDRWILSTLSPEQDFNHDFGQMMRSVTRLSDHRIQVITELKIPEQTVAKEDIATFNRFLDILSRESLIQFAGRNLP